MHIPSVPAVAVELPEELLRKAEEYGKQLAWHTVMSMSEDQLRYAMHATLICFGGNSKSNAYAILREAFSDFPFMAECTLILVQALCPSQRGIIAKHQQHLEDLCSPS